MSGHPRVKHESLQRKLDREPIATELTSRIAPRAATMYGVSATLLMLGVANAEAFAPMAHKYASPTSVPLRMSGGSAEGPRPGTAGVYDTAARPGRVTPTQREACRRPRRPLFS